MSKKLPAYSFEGELQTTLSARQAWDEVREGKSAWLNAADYRHGIYRVHKHLLTRGTVTGQFCDAWALLPSDGIPVWQMRTDRRVGRLTDAPMR